MSRVILGGGVSGLSAAYYLSKNLPNQPATLLESSNRLGGWIKSTKPDQNIIFEEGPRTLRPTGPAGLNTLTMLEDLHLIDEILPISASHPAARNRMIYANKELHSLPSSLTSMFTTQPPFSKPLIAHFAKDLFAAKKTVSDESIYDFVNRRFGTEVADYLISPLICGICAGDAKETSVKFLMNTLFEYEQKYGSISTGLVRNVFKKTSKDALQGLPARAKKERWQIYSFKNGMETLPKALSDHIKHIGVEIVLNSKCERLEFAQRAATLHLSNGSVVEAGHVISSIPAENLGVILRKQHPELADLLGNIKNTTVGVVNLCYKGNLINKPGFGFLVPPKENVPILGVIYDSCIFPKGDYTVLTVMMGGAWFQRLFGDTPGTDVFLQTAREQLGNILRMRDEPVYSKVKILEKCIPQYIVGHSENVSKIQEYVRMNKLPLSVCGASFHGVGINDVILSAKSAVEGFLRDYQ